MTQSYHRRHSRWYEVIIFNFWFQIVIGYLLIVILPQWIFIAPNIWGIQ